VEFLDEHSGDIALVTIDIGANDIFIDCDGDPNCFIPQIATNLPHIVDTLREHAGPGVPIVGMNYYGPDVTQWFEDPAAGEAAAAGSVAFNNFLESLYAGAGTPVADVESAFAVTDFTTLAELKGVGPVPLSVYNACTLTWICTGSTAGPRHPCQLRRLRRHRPGVRVGARRLTHVGRVGASGGRPAPETVAGARLPPPVTRVKQGAVASAARSGCNVRPWPSSDVRSPP
jgi:hypothetical protein